MNALDGRINMNCAKTLISYVVVGLMLYQKATLALTLGDDIPHKVTRYS